MEKFFPSNDCVCEQHDLLGLAWITDATDAILGRRLRPPRTSDSDSDPVLEIKIWGGVVDDLLFEVMTGIEIEVKIEEKMKND